MSKVKLDLLDITNKDHIKLIKKYEETTGIIIDLNIVKTDSNEISTYIFSTKEDSINDICLIQYQKDIKTASITSIGDNSKKFFLDSTNYLLEILGMESVFIRVNKDDNKLMKYLEENDYESLGEEKSDILFLKEKVSEKTSQKTV